MANTKKFKILAELRLEMTEEDTQWFAGIDDSTKEEGLKQAEEEIRKELEYLVSPGTKSSSVTVVLEEVAE